MTDTPIRIGVVSDTHIPGRARAIPASLLRGLEGVDMILHAGDIARISVIRRLEGIAPVHAVYGNMDPSEVRCELPGRRIVTAGGRRIGLIHGAGAAFGLAERVLDAFRDATGGPPEIVVFGHSHEPTETWRNGVLRFNPGSPTDPRFTGIGTYGILTLGEAIEATLVPVA